MLTFGIAGIGHLGKALAQQLGKKNFGISAYHPILKRRKEFEEKFSNTSAVNFNQLLQQPIILLALPAESIRAFLNKAKSNMSETDSKPVFVNLSSLVNTAELQNEFTELKIYGVKMLGHADYLYKYGNGIFLTETPLESNRFQNIRTLFESIGKLFNDNEDIVSELNGLAVKNIIKACMKFTEEAKGYPKEYQNKAMSTIFPNTLHLYLNKTFDGFMLKIMNDIKCE